METALRPTSNFTSKDRLMLQAYFPLADSMADLIGPHCEVVIHSLESFDQSVVKIVNGHHTGRTKGSPITDRGLKMLRLYEQTSDVAPRHYFTYNKKKDLLKSTTHIIIGEAEKPIGLFCVNINLSMPFPEIVKTMLPTYEDLHIAGGENFNTNAKEVIDQSLDWAIQEVQHDKSVNLKNRKKTIVYMLYDNGVFELKDAVATVADRLEITRHAVYKYLREFKAQQL